MRRSRNRPLVLAGTIALALQFTPGGHPWMHGSIGVSPASATQGVGSGTGEAKATIKRISLRTFLQMNRARVTYLRIQNDREDTSVVVEGFPDWVSGHLLQATEYDSGTIKKLIRYLSNVGKLKKRQDIIQAELKRLGVGEKLLRADVQTTRRQISDEVGKINARRESGILKKPFVKTKRLKVLEKALDEQQRRLRRAESVIDFIRNWRSHPHWGK